MAARTLLRRCGAAAAAKPFGSSRAAVAESGADVQLRTAAMLSSGAQTYSAADSTITSSSLASWEMLRSPRPVSCSSRLFSSSRGNPSTTPLSAASQSWLMGWLSVEKPRHWMPDSLSFPVNAFSPSYTSVGCCHYHTMVAPHRPNLELVTRSSLLGSNQRSSDFSSFPGSIQQTRSLSKLKSYKMKPYSSYKERFKTMADGTFKRWRSGTRHNAKSKTAKQRRQLRRPSLAPPALAKIMKKLNFVR